MLFVLDEIGTLKKKTFNSFFMKILGRDEWPVANHFAKRLRSCLVFFFLSLNFRHSSLITYYSSLITLKYHVCLAPSLTSHHSIFFTLFVSLIPVTRCSFFFSSVPKLIEPSEKKKKKTQNMKTKLVKEE